MEAGSRAPTVVQGQSPWGVWGTKPAEVHNIFVEICYSVRVLSACPLGTKSGRATSCPA